MDWNLVGNIVSTIGIPILGFILLAVDRRSKERERSQREFNYLDIQSWEKIGDVVVANAIFSLHGGSDLNRKELETALEAYNKFRKEADEFKNKQTVGTLRN